MKLVVIDWLDSNGHSGWTDVDQIIDGAEVGLECQSVGWILNESKRQVTLVSDVSYRKGKIGSAYGNMTIPKCAIKKIRVIRNG